MACLLLLIAACGAAVAAPTAAGDRGFDPSGVWMGLHGPLALMRAGDGSWEYRDDQGTVTFTTRNGRVTMQVTDGIASFCGDGWPSETFGPDSWEPTFHCRVNAAKAHFLVVGPLPPEPRPGYVVQGDWVEAIGLVNESSPAWLLARYVGKGRTTAWLLERDALECQEGL